MDMNSLGKMLLLFGSALIVLGAAFMFGGKLPWFGKLPGDIYIQKRAFAFFFPVTTSIIISIIMTIIMLLFRRR